MRTSLLIWVGLLLPAVGAEARTWTDVTGAHRLDGQLVHLADGKVRLRAADGRMFSIALDQLSLADREVVRGLDRNLQDSADIPEPAAATVAIVPQTVTAVAQSPSSDGPSTRQIPAPLPLDAQPSSGQIPLIQSAPLSGQPPLPLEGLPPEPTAGLGQGGSLQSGSAQAGSAQSGSAQAGSAPVQRGVQPTDPGKDKRIFSGGRSSFYLHGRDGTGAYWVDGKHYLAKLTWFRTEGDFVYFTGTGEGGVQAWAFFDIESCSNRVYAWKTGASGWRLFDRDDRELPQ